MTPKLYEYKLGTCGRTEVLLGIIKFKGQARDFLCASIASRQHKPGRFRILTQARTES
jgi:hypothetical protein